MIAHVLLIDDEQAFSDSMRAFFQTAGIELDYAGTWKDGLDAFRVGQHELVIADYNLPGSLHGLRLLLEIRRLRPSSRLILISGALRDEAKDLVPKTGLVDRFLPKDDKLAEELLIEAEAAVKRAEGPTDWQQVARAHVNWAALDDKVVENIDQALKSHVAQGQQ